MPELLRPIDPDEQFFSDHPDWKARIRMPFGKEQQGEFWSLGPHESSRRRIIVWRVPDDNPYAKQMKAKTRAMPLWRIPFLAFADETIIDIDTVLLPMIDAIMKDAAEKHGVKIRE